MSLKDVKAGKAILNHKGSEYGFIRDSVEEKTYTKIMVPHSYDDGFRTSKISSNRSDAFISTDTLPAKKSIDHIFHLQQIVKLPNVHDSSSITARSAKAKVPAMKAIRKQPKGLKMRFRPIGFGDGETGKIGFSSSSVDGSSVESASDEEMEDAPAPFRQPTLAKNDAEGDGSSEDSQSGEESSGSDGEMAVAPPLPAKPAVKDKRDKTSAAIASSLGDANGSQKRKHGEREEKNPKHSSSKSSSFGDRELKQLKKKQKKSQRSREDRSSVPIELQKISAQQLSAKPETNSTKRNTPIHPPKSTILPNSSGVAPASQVFPGNHHQGSSDKSKSKKHYSSEHPTPVRKDGVSLSDLTRATDPSLAGEERKKKVRKHKE
jgi:hypothetical protein